jgi:hypothetical protein
MSMYSNKSEQERYFLYWTITTTFIFIVIMAIIVLGFRAGHQTSDNTNKTSVACVKAGGSWLYSTKGDSYKWECKNNYSKTEVVQ